MHKGSPILRLRYIRPAAVDVGENKYIFVAYKGSRRWKHGEHGLICRPATNAEQTTKKRDRTGKEQGKADEGDGAGGYSLIVYLSWNIPRKQRMACGVAHSFRPLPIQTLEGLSFSLVAGAESSWADCSPFELRTSPPPVSSPVVV